MNIRLLDKNTNKPIPGVEWSCAEYEGRLLLNMCNYDWENTYDVKIVVNGQEISAVRDLINEKEAGGTYRLESHVPALLELLK